MKNKRNPEVSIIVPCYNEQYTIQKLLEAIKVQTFPMNEMEVIIADGISTDETRKKISEFVAKNPDLSVKVIDNPKKKIPSAINLAVDAAIGEFIVRMDAHSVPDKNYVFLCIEALKSGKGDCVGGVWEIRPSREDWIARSIAEAAAHPLGVGDALYRFTNKSGEVDTVPFGSFRRALFTQVGGFNEELLTNEDYEFYTRIKKHGGKIWLESAIRCVYFARGSIKELAQQYWRYGYWKFRMLTIYPETLRWRQALPPLFVISLILLVIFSFFSKLIQFILAGVVTTYLFILLMSSISLALRKKDLLLVVGMPFAITTMHISWGGGFLYSMIMRLLKKSDH